MKHLIFEWKPQVTFRTFRTLFLKLFLDKYAIWLHYISIDDHTDQSENPTRSFIHCAKLY